MILGSKATSYNHVGARDIRDMFFWKQNRQSLQNLKYFWGKNVGELLSATATHGPFVADALGLRRNTQPGEKIKQVLYNLLQQNAP